MSRVLNPWMLSHPAHNICFYATSMGWQAWTGSCTCTKPLHMPLSKPQHHAKLQWLDGYGPDVLPWVTELRQWIFWHVDPVLRAVLQQPFLQELSPQVLLQPLHVSAVCFRLEPAHTHTTPLHVSNGNISANFRHVFPRAKFISCSVLCHG